MDNILKRMIIIDIKDSLSYNVGRIFSPYKERRACSFDITKRTGVSMQK